MLTYKKYFDTVMRFFPVFIAYTFFTEMLGYFIINFDEFSFFREKEYAWHNVIIYNIYSILSFSFFFWMYWKLMSKSINKKIVFLLATVTMAAFFISLLLQNPMHTGLYFADIVASYALLLTITLYFREKKQRGFQIIQKNNLMFWISIGLFIFYLVFPHLYFVGFEFPEIWIEYNFRKILQLFIVLMYLLFSVGFLKGKRSSFN
jgi:hypothetical protein